MVMFKEHEQAVLTEDLPEYQLKAGEVVVVVHIHSSNKAYEVEIFTLNGETLDVVSVEAAQLRPVDTRDVMHARPMEQR